MIPSPNGFSCVCAINAKRKEGTQGIWGDNIEECEFCPAGQPLSQDGVSCLSGYDNNTVIVNGTGYSCNISTANYSHFVEAQTTLGTTVLACEECTTVNKSLDISSYDCFPCGHSSMTIVAGKCTCDLNLYDSAGDTCVKREDMQNSDIQAAGSANPVSITRIENDDSFEKEDSWITAQFESRLVTDYFMKVINNIYIYIYIYIGSSRMHNL